MTQPELPITINAAQRFSRSLVPLLNKMEQWLNFQALKAGWYGNEELTLLFHFKIVRTLEEKETSNTSSHSIEEIGIIYSHDTTTQTTTAFIAVSDLIQHGQGIERTIKNRLMTVCNNIALQYDLQPIVIS